MITLPVGNKQSHLKLGLKNKNKTKPLNLGINCMADHFDRGLIFTIIHFLFRPILMIDLDLDLYFSLTIKFEI